MQTFSQKIRQARIEKEYSQRQLAKLIGVDYSYLSKLENDRANYPPSEKVIRLLATHLKLDAIELKKLSGRIKVDLDKILLELVKQHQEIPALLRRMQDDPAFARKILSIASKFD